MEMWLCHFLSLSSGIDSIRPFLDLNPSSNEENLLIMVDFVLLRPYLFCTLQIIAARSGIKQNYSYYLMHKQSETVKNYIVEMLIMKM